MLMYFALTKYQYPCAQFTNCMPNDTQWHYLAWVFRAKNQWLYYILPLYGPDILVCHSDFSYNWDESNLTFVIRRARIVSSQDLNPRHSRNLNCLCLKSMPKFSNFFYAILFSIPSSFCELCNVGATVLVEWFSPGYFLYLMLQTVTGVLSRLALAII